MKKHLLLRFTARRWELFATEKLWITHVFALAEIAVEKWELKWQNFTLDQMASLPLLYFLDHSVDYRKVDLMVVQPAKLLCVFLQSVAPTSGNLASLNKPVISDHQGPTPASAAHSQLHMATWEGDKLPV